jgi:hypothetical protein
VTESNVPGIDAVETKLDVARGYIARGWPVFVLGMSKTPIKNCTRCDTQRADYVPHDRESCECLTCHGFYAATLDDERLRKMLLVRPDGMLALRTGGRKNEGGGLLVIDAEAAADERAEDGLTGLQVLDDWEGWTGFSLPPTLRQRTGSGGIHLAYRVPPGRSVGSHNRVLPQVDVKANGGYVAVFSGGAGCDDGRAWLDSYDALTEASEALLEYVDGRRMGVGSHSRGSWRRGGVGQLLSEEDFQRCLREGARAGEREPFFAMLSFKLFKKGLARWQVEQEMREHWERCEQTPGDEFAWASIEYKLNRDEHGVVATQPLDEKLQDWAERQRSCNEDAVSIDDGTYRIGAVTLARRPR